MLPVTVALNAPPSGDAHLTLLVGESWCLAASRDVCAGQMASLATVSIGELTKSWLHDENGNDDVFAAET